MVDRAELETLITRHGYKDYKWIQPKSIVVAEWVRMKCLFGCSEYGKTATCPPNTPPVPDCRRFFDEYSAAVVFHFKKKVENPEDRYVWSKGVNQELLKLEKAVFFAGYPKAFLLFMDSCSLCEECCGIKKEECKNPKSARPSPESGYGWFLNREAVWLSDRGSVGVFPDDEPLCFPADRIKMPDVGLQKNAEGTWSTRQ